ncbi:MAG TPA: hypothetical protein DGD08_14080 [Gemmatimonas aurantiaca]|uniref:Lipoprotein n=2 Tax=Gemmatimonas aurantiaca TaxID=173480 RepID=C1AA65_GEMAT|nr:hypothetical protein [Gemmatimonas aurantiaca]BAH39663.1 hypothetical protein GAU_2621 [Gemmatimonas aurantiaca T-27]HCT58328.1 hypothetical protein [Gemmatimonas aurantiaca]
MHRLIHSARLGAVAVSLSGALLLAACGSDDDDNGVGPETDAQIALGFQVARGAQSAGDVGVTAGAAGTTIGRGTDTIVVTSAELVLRDVRLHGEGTSCLANDSTLTAGCATIRLRPMILDLPVNGTDGNRVTVTTPRGTFSSVRLNLHKPIAGDSIDAAFRLANPTFADISVRLEGTYNGEAFEYTTDVSEVITVPLTAAVSGGDDLQQVTVLVDIGKWFWGAEGGLLSPIAAGDPGTVADAVNANVRTSFKAFRDQNRDGTPD